MRVRSKLFIAFGVIIFASVAVALVALLALSSLSASIDNLLDTRIPQLQRVSAIDEAIYTSAIHIDEALLAGDPASVHEELEQTTTNREATNENMGKLKASLASDQEKALYQAIIDKRTPYVAKRDELVKLAGDGRKAEAVQQLDALKSLRGPFLKALKDLDLLVQDQARQAHDQTISQSRMARARAGGRGGGVPGASPRWPWPGSCAASPFPCGPSSAGWRAWARATSPSAWTPAARTSSARWAPPLNQAMASLR